MQFVKRESERVLIFKAAVELYTSGVPMVNYQHDGFKMEPHMLGERPRDLLKELESLIESTNWNLNVFHDDEIENLCWVLDRNAHQICNHMYYHGMIVKDFESGYYE